MNFLKLLFAGPVPARPYFLLFDGTRLSPETYGEMSLKSSWQSAVEEVQTTLSQSGRASELKLVKALEGRALHAALCVQMLKAAIYMWYAASALHADSRIMEGIKTGLERTLLKFQTSTGDHLSDAVRTRLMHQIFCFSLALEKDKEERSIRAEGVFRVTALPSTELLLCDLARAASADESTAKEWAEEITTSTAGWLLRGLLDASTTGTISALQDELKLSLAR